MARARLRRYAAFVRDRPALGAVLLGVPVIGWFAFWVFGAYALLLLQGFWKVDSFGLSIQREFGLQNFETIFSGHLYRVVIARSLGIGLAVTVLCTALAFPVAYFLALKVKRGRMILYGLVIVPLWASYLVRAYAWKTILGTDGVVNSLLRSVGVIDEPLTFLLYSRWGVIITLTHIYTPFMILTIFTTLERIRPSLIEASKDLGVGGLRTFLHVVVPLSIPGVLAGAIFTLGLAAGDFIAPTLVGGPDSTMVANLVSTQFGVVNNWPLGSALGFVLLAFVVVLVLLTSYLEKREEI